MIDVCEGLNEEQKQAVLVQTNAVVAAGAGSGKTKVLTSRYVYLITEKGCRVESILALTFTEKAAAEMYQRIYAALLYAAHAQAESLQKKRAEQALQEFYHAQIMTLDSWCYKIAKNACRRFGISPDFTIDLRESKRLAYNLSLDFFLARRHDEVLQYFLDNHSIKDFVEQFFVKLLTEHVSVSRPLNFFDMLQQQQKHIEQTYRLLYNKLTTLFSQFEDYTSHKDTFITAMAAAYKAMPVVPDSMEKENFCLFLQTFYNLTKVSMRKGSTKAPDVLMCKTLLKDIRAVYTDMLNAYHVHFHKSSLEKMYALCSILQEQYIAEKKRRSILTFADVEYLAVDALIADPDMRLFYKKSITHIMIDEFQDNNSLQRDLLFLLAEKYDRMEQSVPPSTCLVPDKLFFVGDEKQSIYAFRGADVSVFRTLSRDLSGINGSAQTPLLNLRMNYRTEPMLIDFFNKVFSRVFYSKVNQPEAGTAVPDYEAEFTNIHSREALPCLAPKADIFFVDSKRFQPENDAVLSARDTEACVLAQEIKKLYNEKTLVYDDELKQVRPCCWSDFAILLRASSHQAAYERFLRLYSIPYITVQQKSLFQDAPLLDLYALLRLAVYPQDRYTYAQVLRSPFVHISDLSVTSLLLQQSPPFAPQLDTVVEPEDVPYFQRACGLFARICAYKKTMTNAELVTALWYDEAYRYVLLTKESYHRYLEWYDYLFALAVQADAAALTLSDFVDELAAYIKKEKNIDDMEVPLEHNVDAVKIMTVHKSKGLEFPIVCIPDCGNAGQNEKKDGLIFCHNTLGIISHLPQIAGLSVQKNPVFESLRIEANAKLFAEAKRLLYVAMTRAKVRLVMTGTYKTTAKIETLPEKARSFEEVLEAMRPPTAEEKNTSFFELLFATKVCADKSCAAFTEVLPIASDMAMHFSKKQVVAAELLAAQYAAAYEKQFSPDTRVFMPATQLEKDAQRYLFAQDYRDIHTKYDSLSQTAFGTLVHKAIEARFLHTPFYAPKAQSHEIEALCDGFFASELGKKAAQAAFRKTEYGFMSNYEGTIIVGQIDLLFEDENTVYIVDYKTDTQKRPEQHRKQLLAYKHAVAQLYELTGFGNPRSVNTETNRQTHAPIAKKTIRAFLFYLRHQSAVEITEGHL